MMYASWRSSRGLKQPTAAAVGGVAAAGARLLREHVEMHSNKLPAAQSPGIGAYRP